MGGEGFEDRLWRDLLRGCHGWLLLSRVASASEVLAPSQARSQGHLRTFIDAGRSRLPAWARRRVGSPTPVPSTRSGTSTGSDRWPPKEWTSLVRRACSTPWWYLGPGSSMPAAGRGAWARSWPRVATSWSGSTSTRL